MKIITAIVRPVRPVRLEALRSALRRLPDFSCMTITDCGGMSAPDRVGENRDPLADFSSKVRIEIVTDDAQTRQIIETIRSCAATGHVGDGLVWVTPVEEMWRIGPEGMRPDAGN